MQESRDERYDRLLKEHKERKERRRVTWQSLSVDAIDDAEEGNHITLLHAAYLRRMLHNRETIKILCPPTKHQIYTRGLGYRRSCDDKPIDCYVLASFYYPGGGGYVVEKPNMKIIQVQSFHVKEA